MDVISTLIVAAANGSRLGTAQDMTFAIPLGVFMALAVAQLFWLRSGHERASRNIQVRRQIEKERTQERSRILEAHEIPAGHGEGLPR